MSQNTLSYLGIFGMLTKKIQSFFHLLLRYPKNRKQRPKWLFKILFLFVSILITLFTVHRAEPKLPQSQFPIAFYSNQAHHDLQETLYAALNRSQKSILIAIFNLTDPKIIDILNKKALQGVHVEIIYDVNTNQKLKERLTQKIRKYPFHPKGLMHQKIIIIDGLSTWIGSANFTRASLRHYPNLIVGIEHPYLATALTKYLEPMKHNKIATRGISPKNYLANGQRIELWGLPQEKHADQKIIELIESARSQIDIHMYTWTREDFADAVIRAHNKGIKVRVALDRQSSSGFSKKIYKKLVDAKIPVKTNIDKGLLHYKTVMIDRKTIACGSTNWTKAAFNKNNDIFLVIYDLTSEQLQTLDKMVDTVEAVSRQAA